MAHVLLEDSHAAPQRRGRHEKARTAQSGPRAMSSAATVWIAAVIVAEIVAIAVFGSITIARYPLWSVIDEGAHYDNVIYVAAHGSYPVLGKSLASPEELAIGQGRYPRPTTINPKTDGVSGLDYEAFQPPLYYYVAAPVSLLSSNYHTKAILLRAFGLVLLMVAIGLFARLSRHVLKDQWLLGLAGGLLVFFMPGVLVRMVTISDINLAVPLAVLTVTELWIAWERQSHRRLLLCGFLVGCGVLTDLYLTEMVPVYVCVAGTIVWRNRAKIGLAYAALGGVIGVLVALPWLAFNEVKYHALTASALAKREQLALINPDHLRFTIGQLPGLTVIRFFQPLMPQEWFVGSAFYAYVILLFEVLLLPAAIVLAITLGKRFFSSGLWIFVLPIVGNIGLAYYIDLGQQWQAGSMVPRFIYPTLPFVALFVVAAYLRLASSIRPLVVTLTVSGLFLGALWVHLVPIIHHTPSA
jgi:4-amino-4-deoxy-L-arabinose transferase-like glycosyltransferase